MKVGDEGYQIYSNTIYTSLAVYILARSIPQLPPRAHSERCRLSPAPGRRDKLKWRRAWPCSLPRKGPSSRRVRRTSTGRTSGTTSRCSSRHLTSSGRLQSRRLQHQLQLHRRNPRLHKLLCACQLRHPLLGPRRVLPNPNPPRRLAPVRAGASRPRWTRPRGSGSSPSLASCASRAARSSSSRGS